MTASYTITEADYVQAMKLYSRPKPLLVAILVLIAVAFIIAIAFGPAALRPGAIGGLVGGLSVMILGRLFFNPMQTKRLYRKYKAMQEPIMIERQDAGIEFNSASGRALLRWDKLLKWRQNERYLLLYTMPRLYHIVPKSIADQGFDLDALIERLQSHLGKAS